MAIETVYIAGFPEQNGSYEQFRQTIISGVKEALGKTNEENKQFHNKTSQQQAAERKKLEEFVKNVYLFQNGSIIDRKKQAAAQQKFDLAIKNGLDKSLDNAAKTVRYVSLIYSSITTLVSELAKPTGQRFKWLQELETAGVHLTEGFDNSFTQLANDAKLSHDQFVRLMTSNSQTISRLNSINLNGAKVLSGALNKTVGNFGYTADDASVALKGYMESFLDISSQGVIAEKTKIDASVRYLKNLKELSSATGKSVQQLEQERKMREDNLFTRKLQAEHPELISAFHAAGITDDAMIRALVTGRQNDTSILAQITPEGRKTFSDLSRLARLSVNGSLSNEQMLMSLDKILRSESVNAGKQRMENMGYQMADIFAQSDAHNKGFGFVQGLRNGLDIESLRKTMGNTGDVNSVNAYTNFQSSKNILDNGVNKSMSTSTSFASPFLNMTGGLFRGVGDLLSSTFGHIGGIALQFFKTPFGALVGQGMLGGTFIMKKNIVTALEEYYGKKKKKKTAFEKYIDKLAKPAKKQLKLLEKQEGVMNSIKKGLLTFYTKHPLMGRLGVIAGGVVAITAALGIMNNMLDGISNMTGGGLGGGIAGALVGGIMGAMMGAITGGIIGSYIPLPGATAKGMLIGAAVGAVGGGIYGAIKGSKSPAEQTKSSGLDSDIAELEKDYYQRNKSKNEEELRDKNTILSKLDIIATNTGSTSHYAEKQVRNDELNKLSTPIMNYGSAY